MNIDYLWAYQVFLVYPVTNFDKIYQHWGLISYDWKVCMARSLIKNALKLQVPDLYWVIVHKLRFLLVSALVIQTPLPTVSQECICCNWKSLIYEQQGFFYIKQILNLSMKKKRNFNPKFINILLFLMKWLADIRFSRLHVKSFFKSNMWKSKSNPSSL